MSEMSFKQAKELVERMEFSEIAIRKSIDNLEKASCSFQESLKLQEDIVNRLPYSDKKLSIFCSKSVPSLATKKFSSVEFSSTC